MNAGTEQAAQAGPRAEIGFITLLRACSVVLVVYAHVVGGYLVAVGMHWPPAELVTAFVMRPFALILNAGFAAVVVLFLISGFIITHVALRESRREFAVKRLLRIYPPLLVSVAIVTVTEMLRGHPLQPPVVYALAATLTDFVVTPQTLFNGVAWSLVVEVSFYAMVFAALPWLKLRPLVTCAGFTTLSVLLILTSHMFGLTYGVFALYAAYLPYVLTGQALYFVWTGRISPARFAGLTAYVMFSIILGVHMIFSNYYGAAQSYGVSFLDAYLLFAVCLAAARWVRPPPVMEYIASISYSLYLVHAAVGYLVLDTLVPRTGYTVALAAALVTIGIVAALMHRFVEEPSQRVASRLLRRARPLDADARWSSRPSPAR